MTVAFMAKKNTPTHSICSTALGTVGIGLVVKGSYDLWDLFTAKTYTFKERCARIRHGSYQSS